MDFVEDEVVVVFGDLCELCVWIEFFFEGCNCVGFGVF